MYISYYSSERIKNVEPIYITDIYSYYNEYGRSYVILDEYESKCVYETHNLEDLILCEEMIEPFKFKFAD